MTPIMMKGGRERPAPASVPLNCCSTAHKLRAVWGCSVGIRLVSAVGLIPLCYAIDTVIPSTLLHVLVHILQLSTFFYHL